MCNKLFPKDDPAALAYIAAKLAAAGYEDEAWLIKQQPGLVEMIYKLVIHFSERGGQAFADAWKGVRQLTGALQKWMHEHLQPYTKFGDER